MNKANSEHSASSSKSFQAKSCSVDSLCVIVVAPCLLVAAVVACVLGDADLRGLFLSGGGVQSMAGEKRPAGCTGSSPRQMSVCGRLLLEPSCLGQDHSISLFPCLQKLKGLFSWPPSLWHSRCFTLREPVTWSVPGILAYFKKCSLSLFFVCNVLPNRDCHSNCRTIFKLFSSKIVWIFIWN